MAREGKNWGGEVQVVVFHLGAEEYGVDIAGVQEIIRVPSITRVPKAPRFVEGVINLRGKVVPVVDLRGRFSLDVTEQTKQSRIVVADVGSMTVGMMVDDVSEVLRIDMEKVEPPPLVATTIDSACIRGIANLEERLVILMDLERVLTTNEVTSTQESGVLVAAPALAIK